MRWIGLVATVILLGGCGDDKASPNDQRNEAIAAMTIDDRLASADQAALLDAAMFEIQARAFGLEPINGRDDERITDVTAAAIKASQSVDGAASAWALLTEAPIADEFRPEAIGLFLFLHGLGEDVGDSDRYATEAELRAFIRFLDEKLDHPFSARRHDWMNPNLFGDEAEHQFVEPRTTFSFGDEQGLVRLLWARMHFAVQDGDDAEFVSAYASLASLARAQFFSPPSVVSATLANGMTRRVAPLLTRAVESGMLNDSQLARLAEIVSKPAALAFEAAVIGEYAFTAKFRVSGYSDEDDDDFDVLASDLADAVIRDTAEGDIETFGEMSATAERALATSIIDWCNAMLARDDAARADADRRFNEIITSDEPVQGVYASIRRPWVASMTEARAATVTIAAHRHRLSHGELPASLDEIDDDLLPPAEEIADMLAPGFPQLRLKLDDDDHVMVYSIGPDGEDNDGAAADIARGDWQRAPAGTDVVLWPIDE
ncbi:MAG: hypothetical protein AAF747_06475 [Planctomycetota bacterium]